MQQDLESGRVPQDLSHLIFQTGRIGQLMTLSQIPVVAGDSFEQNLVGALKMSPMRRNLTLDAKIDVFTFFVPHRHIYGDRWVDFLKSGASTPTTPNVLSGSTFVNQDQWATLGLSRDVVEPGSDTTLRRPVPQFMHDGYVKIWQNYFANPEDYADTDIMPNITSPLKCAHLKSIWNAPLPDNKRTDNEKIGTDASVYDIAEQFAKHHTDEERTYFAQRYRDVVQRLFKGDTTADVDNRPSLFGRSSQWASGYDVDGTGDTSLGQYTGRVVTNINHRVPRRFIPEHGVVWTVAVVRYPTIIASENHYFANGGDALTYESLACDPALLNNMPPIEIRLDEFFNGSDVSNSGLRKYAFGQWYREQPSFVANKYTQLNGFPFLKFPPSNVQTTSWYYINPDDYDDVFQTTQLDHWNCQMRNNVTVMRAIPSARNAIMAAE